MEQTPSFETISRVSIARDITLRKGEVYVDPVTEVSSVRSSWQSSDGLLDYTLFSSGLYASTQYTLDVKHTSESGLHRYTLTASSGQINYEYPPGESQTDQHDQAVLAEYLDKHLATGWAPESIRYDRQQFQYQKDFVLHSGRTALQHLLEHPDARDLAAQLPGLYEDKERYHQVMADMYALSQVIEPPFRVSKSLLESIIDSIVAEGLADQRTLPPAP